MYLYLDTTDTINFGILDKDFNWLDYKEDKSSKISAEIHAGIYSMLEKLKLDFSNIKALAYCSGPGSYTGMRVSEGLAQILNWQSIPLFSFHHFEIPKILGFDNGVWIAKAFKGEVFKYEWSLSKSSKKLILEKSLNVTEHDQIFSHRIGYCDSNISTIELVQNRPQDIFSYIVGNEIKRDLFYYRELEEEFSKK